MEEHIVKLISKTPVTHDTHLYKVEKPAGYTFIPGQATEVAIRKPGWEEERRPFTFTGLNEWDHLEFTIKSYYDRNGVTKELATLNPGDELLLHDVWGAIHYDGPGVFIAGGAGITPFIAIFRDLEKRKLLPGNKLLFANKRESDIILKDQFHGWLGDRFINILSDEMSNTYAHGFITKDFLLEHISDLSQKFYICGPPPMMDAVQNILKELGVGDQAVIVEL